MKPSDPNASGTEDPRSTVLFVVLAAGLGGSTRSVATVLAHLVSPGIRRRLLATPPRGRFIDLVIERGLADDVVPLPADAGKLRRLSRVRAAWRVGSWLRRSRGVAGRSTTNGPEELNVVGPAALAFLDPGRPVEPRARGVAVACAGSGSWPRVLRDLRFAAVSPLARRVLVDGGLARSSQVQISPEPDRRRMMWLGVRDEHDDLTVGYLDLPPR